MLRLIDWSLYADGDSPLHLPRFLTLFRIILHESYCVCPFLHLLRPVPIMFHLRICSKLLISFFPYCLLSFPACIDSFHNQDASNDEDFFEQDHAHLHPDASLQQPLRTTGDIKMFDCTNFLPFPRDLLVYLYISFSSISTYFYMFIQRTMFSSFSHLTPVFHHACFDELYSVFRKNYGASRRRASNSTRRSAWRTIRDLCGFDHVLFLLS